MNSWSHSWSCVVGDGHFPSKTVVGHEIGHMVAMLGVGRVVCIKHRDFGETNRNTNYLSAVMSTVRPRNQVASRQNP